MDINVNSPNLTCYTIIITQKLQPLFGGHHCRFPWLATEFAASCVTIQPNPMWSIEVIHLSD